MEVLGIDIGGSGIKGALVDIEKGQLLSERRRLETPRPATPAEVIAATAELIRLFDWNGVVGCGFPAVIADGRAATAANIDEAWIGMDVGQALREATGLECRVVNDADAAGLAEMEFGAGRDCSASVLLLTLGTGIGSALFHRKCLFPNLELGSLPLEGGPAEHYAAAAVRKNLKLGWKAWAERLNLFLKHVERMLSPELIIIGGGVSRKSEKFLPLLQTRAQVVPARFLNQAGIIGAACFAGARASAARPAEDAPQRP